jgi:hypothetical protein
MAQQFPLLQDQRFMRWFDNATPQERERFRREEEEFWADMDLTVYAQTFGDLHPNEGYEYEPLIPHKTLWRKI